MSYICYTFAVWVYGAMAPGFKISGHYIMHTKPIYLQFSKLSFYPHIAYNVIQEVYCVMGHQYLEYYGELCCAIWPPEY